MNHIPNTFHGDLASNCQEILLWTEVLDRQTNQLGPAVSWARKTKTRLSEEVLFLKIERPTYKKAKPWKGNERDQVRPCQVEKEKTTKAAQDFFLTGSQRQYNMNTQHNPLRQICLLYK